MGGPTDRVALKKAVINRRFNGGRIRQSS